MIAADAKRVSSGASTQDPVVLDLYANTCLKFLVDFEQARRFNEPQVQQGNKMSSHPSRNERYAKTFRFIGSKGEPIFPIRQMAGMSFVLAKRGTGANRNERKICITDEEKAYQMVASGSYLIRAIREDDVAPSLLGLGNRAVRDVIRI